jgi:hypothetical protein
LKGAHSDGAGGVRADPRRCRRPGDRDSATTGRRQRALASSVRTSQQAAKAAYLAKWALTRTSGDPNPDAEIAVLEAEITDASMPPASGPPASAAP